MAGGQFRRLENQIIQEVDVFLKIKLIYSMILLTGHLKKNRVSENADILMYFELVTSLLYLAMF